MIDLGKQIAYLKTMDETVEVAYEIEKMLSDIKDLDDDLRAWLDDARDEMTSNELHDLCLIPDMVNKWLPPFVTKMALGDVCLVLKDYE